MFCFYIIILSNHIINGLLTEFARAILRNTGPWSFSTALASSGCTKTAVLYFSVWPSHPVNKPLIKLYDLRAVNLDRATTPNDQRRLHRPRRLGKHPESTTKTSGATPRTNRPLLGPKGKGSKSLSKKRQEPQREQSELTPPNSQ